MGIIGSDSPSFVNAEYLDDQLVQLWPTLSPESRLIVLILTEQLADAGGRSDW